eukprot:3698432-Rhodomonas_salina.3
MHSPGGCALGWISATAGQDPPSGFGKGDLGPVSLAQSRAKGCGRRIGPGDVGWKPLKIGESRGCCDSTAKSITTKPQIKQNLYQECGVRKEGRHAGPPGRQGCSARARPTVPGGR